MISTTTRKNFIIQDLPSRAIPLEFESLQNVYGGCSSIGTACNKNSDCCSNACFTGLGDRKRCQ